MSNADNYNVRVKVSLKIVFTDALGIVLCHASLCKYPMLSRSQTAVVHSQPVTQLDFPYKTVFRFIIELLVSFDGALFDTVWAILPNSTIASDEWNCSEMSTNRSFGILVGR